MFFQQLKEKFLAVSIRLYFSPVIITCLTIMVALVGVSTVVEAQPVEYSPVPQQWFEEGYCRIIALAVGSFGALVMVVAGIIAIFSAAGGNYRAAVTVLMVACGAYILHTLIGLFFSLDFDCIITTGNIGDGGGGGNQLIIDFGGN